MELKEIYIAPEVELLLFRPVETLADNSFWTTYGSGGSGQAGGDGIIESNGGDTVTDENEEGNGEP